MDGYPKIKLKIYENCSTIGVEISELISDPLVINPDFVIVGLSQLCTLSNKIVKILHSIGVT